MVFTTFYLFYDFNYLLHFEDKIIIKYNLKYNTSLKNTEDIKYKSNLQTKC